jgi:hypothetical protein
MLDTGGWKSVVGIHCMEAGLGIIKVDGNIFFKIKD